MVHLLAPAAIAGEAVLDQHLLRQHQDEGQRGGGNRSPHAVRGDRQPDTGSGAGRHVEAVVPDTDARQQPQTLAWRTQAARQHPGVHGADGVITLGLRRADVQRGLLHVFPFDGRVVQQLQHLGAGGHPLALPHPHHGPAHCRGVLAARERQDARTGAADHAPPGARFDGCLPHLTAALDQAPAVGLVDAVVHAIGDQIAVAGAQTLQQQGE